MIKKLIEPLQKILIQKKMCPACTRSLTNASIIQSRINGTDLVRCDCSRIFVYNKSLDLYHRALPEEVIKKVI